MGQLRPQQRQPTKNTRWTQRGLYGTTRISGFWQSLYVYEARCHLPTHPAQTRTHSRECRRHPLSRGSRRRRRQLRRRVLADLRVMRPHTRPKIAFARRRRGRRLGWRRRGWPHGWGRRGDEGPFRRRGPEMGKQKLGFCFYIYILLIFKVLGFK